MKSRQEQAGNMIKKLLDRLQQSALIRWQILIYLYVSGTYKCVVNMCHLAYQNASRHSTFGYARSHHINQLQWSSPDTRQPTTDDGGHGMSNHGGWCLPPLLPIMEWYRWLSLATLVYVVLINTLPLEDYLWQLMGPLDKPAHCYTPGRLILYSTLPQRTALGVSLTHITWHTLMYHKFKHFELNMVAFMIQSEELVKQKHDKLARHLERPEVGKHGLDQYELYLANILYNPARIRGREVFILRPNRTSAARQAVARFIAKCSLISGSVLVVLSMILTPVIVSSIVRDLTYLDRYPGCSPQLEAMASGRGLSWASVSCWGHWHKLISNLADILVNWVLWFDSGAAVAITISFTYLFNYDFLYYWAQIQLKLDQIDLMLKLQWATACLARKEAGKSKGAAAAAAEAGEEEEVPDWYHYAEAFRHRRHYRHNFLRSRRPPMLGPMDPQTSGQEQQPEPLHVERKTGAPQGHNKARTRQNEAMEEMIAVVQWQLIDFFLQLRAVDRLVSDIVSYSVLIWLAIFTFGTLYFLMNGATLVAFELRLIQVVAVITLTIQNIILLRLRRTLNGSYKTVCSIMAYDQSPYKSRFSKILDNWTGRHGASSWTLFHRYAFTSTTSLTLVGWSVSFVMVSESFINRH